MDCNLTIIDHLINCRYSPGRENLGTPVGIVLRDMTLPLGQYLLTPTTKVERSYPLSYPKSVHFAVSGDGSTYRLVDVNDTAWGLDRYLNTNVPGIPVTTDPSTPWVFVGIDNEDGGPCTVSTGQLDSLVSLICCLCRDFGIAPSETTILTAFDLDESLDSLQTLPATLIELVRSCLLTPQASPLLNLGDIQDAITALEMCCGNHTTQIQELFVRLQTQEALTANLPTRITDLENRLATLEANWAAWIPTVANIPSQIQALQVLYNKLKECTDIVCPTGTCAALDGVEIQYTFSPGQTQTITPNVPVWINFATKISDTVPNSVLPGPLWAATLSDPCTYQIEVTLRLDSSNWCMNKKVRLYLVVGGATVVLDEQILVGGGASVTLHGQTVVTIPPTITDIHALVWTDDITSPAKIISSGNISITC